jgi:hypothetical protein
MKKIVIITAIIILLPLLIFWLGNFHFSKHYLIGRDIPFEKISKLKVDDWKDAGGYGITGRDFLEFGEDWYEIKNDTLYFGEQPVAKVISLVNRCFIDYELTIQSFDGQKTGFYVSK